MRLLFRLLVGLIVVWAVLPILSCATGSEPEPSPSTAERGFVTVEGHTFQVDGRPHAFCGFNFWAAMNLAAAEGGDRQRLAAELDHLQRLGVTNLRVMAASEGPDTEPYRVVPALMIEPGRYNPSLLEGLDYLLAECRERKLRVVMVLNNFWQWSGGMAQYVSWDEGSEIPYPGEHDWTVFTEYASRFYGNPSCQQWYRDHILTLIERVNRITGVTYRDDPTIFAWELANEPRLYPQNWIDETAAFIKQHDPDHLVTTGSEGTVGGDFPLTHDGGDIDYATVHIWPQNWDWFEPREPETYDEAERKALRYLQDHVEQAMRLGKPLVLEEFGLARDWRPGQDHHDPRATTVLRDRFFRTLLDEVAASVRSGGPLSGDNIWAWSGQGRPGDPWIGDPPHERPGWYSVYDRDTSTLEILVRHAREIGDRP